MNIRSLVSSDQIIDMICHYLDFNSVEIYHPLRKGLPKAKKPNIDGATSERYLH